MHPDSKPPWSAPAPRRETRGTPWVSYAVLGGSVALFVLERYAQAASPELAERLYDVVDIDGRAGAVQPLALFRPFIVQGQWWRIFGAVFEHGSILHIVLNMSVVISMGFVYERAIGSGRFLLISIAAALGAAAVTLQFQYAVPSVGASGVILGWAGAILPVATQTHRRDLYTWLIQVAIISFLPFVSWSGHLGGFLGGLACGGLLKRGPATFRYGAPVVIFALAALNVVVLWGSAR